MLDAHAAFVQRIEALRARIHAWVDGCALGHEVVVAHLRAESSDFVRLNRGRIRQAGRVERASLELRLIEPAASLSASLQWTLPQPMDAVEAQLDARLTELRGYVREATPDPYLNWATQPWTSTVDQLQAMPSAQHLAEVLTGETGPGELVAFCMSGPMMTGVWSSVGIALWHRSSRWSLDGSLYAGPPAAPDKAVKFQCSAQHWEPERIAQALHEARARVAVLQRPELRLAPGHCRAWLAPAATAELLSMLSWGGFSASALKSGQSPLLDLQQGRLALHPRVHLSEALGRAGAPGFDAQGRARAAHLDLVKEGRWVQSLVGPRSAKEFALEHNGAAAHEAPEVLCMAPGDMPAHAALERLGTGLAISNLWYLNFSDRQRCRITGMTRFACLWIENGVPVAPVAPMRFDDALLELLGPRLEAIEDTAHWLQDTDSYDWRSFHGVEVPGLLLSGLALAL